MHKRLQPFVHAFRYRVFSLYVDLDEVPALHRDLRLLSHNRWNLFSFHDRDHGPRDGSPLRPWIEAKLNAAGISLAGGSVRLLCFPRVLGYVFNPMSVWFCSHAEGALRAIVYEVSNTFGEHHCYLIPVTGKSADGGVIAQSAGKRLYVSPFIEMGSRYDFRLAVPDHKLTLAIQQSVPDGLLLVARHSGRRRALNDGSLLRAFLAYPLMTLKVIGAIHWEALWLWVKGARPLPRPAPPATPVALVQETSLAEAGELCPPQPR